jgi:sugar-specific transcriptional regulator TrmB
LLIKQRKKEISETEKKAEKLIDSFSQENPKTNQEDSFFILVPEKQAYIRKFQNLILKTEIGCDMLLCWENFRYGMIDDFDSWEKTIAKGVKVRFIVYKTKEEKDVSRAVELLQKKGTFEVRYIFAPPPATMAIFDKKEASISVCPEPRPQNTSSLWSNNIGLIAIFQDYFELMWRTAYKGKQILEEGVDYLQGYT